jgi:magnesium and cobalt transporter
MSDEAKNENKANGDTNLSRWWRRVTHTLAGGPRTRDDLLKLLHDARESELMDGDALSMFEGILQTAETQVRDVMVPRAQVVVVDRAWPLERILPVVIESGHSRFPVVGESKDEVVGVLHAKDLLKYGASAPGGDLLSFDIQRHLRPVVFVPESKRLNVLLKDFRRGRNHMAIVVDEYGGVAGLVTIEDVLEQIVGDIADEFDEAEGARILKQDERRYLVNGLTTIEEFNRYFGTEFGSEEFDTIGGLVMHRFGHLPRRGESVRMERYNFIVQRADSRRVHMFQVTLAPG